MRLIEDQDLQFISMSNARADPNFLYLALALFGLPGWAEAAYTRLEGSVRRTPAEKSKQCKQGNKFLHVGQPLINGILKITIIHSQKFKFSKLHHIA